MASEPAPAPFRTSLRIRFAHCDPAGIVYFPRYFDLFHSVMENWFVDGMGIDYWRTLREERIGFPSVHAEADYLKPSRMGDILAFELKVERLGERSMTLAIEASGPEGPRVRGRLVVVLVDLDRHVSQPIPPHLRAAFERYLVPCPA